jgi:uncharacterized membrane protein
MLARSPDAVIGQAPFGSFKLGRFGRLAMCLPYTCCLFLLLHNGGVSGLILHRWRNRMRSTANPNIAEFLATAIAGCVALAAAVAWPGGSAQAGAITNVGPAQQNTVDSFGLDESDTGPLIEFSLSPNDIGPSGDTAASSDPAQQAGVPWIIQDQHSLDWFGHRDDVLSLEAENMTTRVQPQTPVIDVLIGPSGTQSGGDTTHSQRDGQSKTLGDMMTATVTSVFAAFGFVKTIFVLIPIVVLALFIGAKQMARVLRASQGLDPVKGEHRWGIKRTGEFGPISETNDNARRSKRREDVA